MNEKQSINAEDTDQTPHNSINDVKTPNLPFDKDKAELYVDMLTYYFQQFLNEDIFNETPLPCYIQYSQEEEELLKTFLEYYKAFIDPFYRSVGNE